jgi:hypothetical protein
MRREAQARTDHMEQTMCPEEGHRVWLALSPRSAVMRDEILP